MLMPSIFGENLFDDFFTPFYYDDKDEKKAEKKKQESLEAPADFLRAGFTPQLTEELARALLQLKMELYREDVKNYTFQIKRDGEKIVLIPKYKK